MLVWDRHFLIRTGWVSLLKVAAPKHRTPKGVPILIVRDL